MTTATPEALKLSERINRIEPSATMAVVAEADKLRAQGIDVVDFGAGEPHFATPQHIKDAAIAAIRNNFTKYTAVPALKAARGAICNTASIAGVMGSGSSIPYATSKAGLINLTRSLARTLAPEIRVNAVAPGFVDSPWNKDWPSDRKQVSIERTPLKRACTPADIAETIFFLCAGAAMITGQTVIVDGGLTL